MGRPRRGSPERADKRAFSLIEVMIAILILGIAMVGFVNGITTALSSHKDSEVQTIGVLLASGRMEKIRTDGELEDGESDGDWGDDYPNYQWKQTTSPTDIKGLHEVTVVVENSKTGKQIYELKTMLLEVPLTTDDEANAKQTARSKKRRKGEEP
jgi:prepilin-type N-terminal cleavage/methylation domain-containing protein